MLAGRAEAGAEPRGGDVVRATRRGRSRTAQTTARGEGETPAESRSFSKLPAARLGTPADSAPHPAARLQGGPREVQEKTLRIYPEGTWRNRTLLPFSLSLSRDTFPSLYLPRL